MDSRIILNKRPKLCRPNMIVGWDWPDAGRVGAIAVDYLAEKAGAVKFAFIQSDDFCLTPRSEVSGGVLVDMEYINNDFYYLTNESSNQDLILFSSSQPHINQKEYLNLVIDLAEEFNVSRIFTLGGVSANVHYMTPTEMFAIVNDSSLKSDIENYELNFGGDYQGPSSMSGQLLHVASRRSVHGISMWAMVPHYLPYPPLEILDFPPAAKAILEKITDILSISIDYSELDLTLEVTLNQIKQKLRKGKDEDNSVPDGGENSGPVMH